jgi:ATP-dependent RNA helicase DeaD
MSVDFSTLGLDAEMLAAIARKGFEEATPIQALAIPLLLEEGGHILAKARTGTGKTAAFGLPIVQRLKRGAGPGTRALVIVPTRELALQVSGEIASFRQGERPSVAAVYGGASYGEQFRRLGRGADIVVGTPGRLIDHIERGSLSLSALEWLVLDEADEMLDMGFIEDIESILSASSPDKRVLLFSATMPREILRIAERHLGEYRSLVDESAEVEQGLTEQIWLEVHERDKLEALRRIVDAEDDFYGIVFCATKVDADELARKLSAMGYQAEALHGDISQPERERILAKFRTGQARILAATDVAARGIDVESLSHVVNYSLPHDPESYTHRIGRTGRAGRSGTAITLVTPDEYRRLFFLRKTSGKALRKGAIPDVEALMELKRGRILAKVKAADGSPFAELAERLLAEMEPKAALASCLAAAFEGSLDPGAYRELKEVRPADDGRGRRASVDGAGTTRLYIGLGRAEGAAKRDIARMVRDLTGLPDAMIDGIEIYERCSFVRIPFDAAEKAIARARRGGLPPIRKATPRREGPSERRPRSRPA